MSRSAGVAVVGLGAIGSHTASLIARLREVDRLFLIDPDTYSAENLRGQNVPAEAVGASKALFQTHLVKNIRSDLGTHPYSAYVEDLPPGLLRGKVILSCVDSRVSRRYLNEVAWRLGVPLIDAAVEGVNLQCKISVYVPTADSACLECSWSRRDYELQEQRYPCGTERNGSYPTDSPGFVGALAASLQAAEAYRIVTGETQIAGPAKQLFLDLRHNVYYKTTLERNPACRFDHEVWDIRDWDRSLDTELGELAANNGQTYHKDTTLSIPCKSFLTRMVCPQCRRSRRILRLERRLKERDRICNSCGSEMAPVGFDVKNSLQLSALSQKELSESLRSVGFRREEIFTLKENGKEVHFYIPGR